MAHGLGGLNPVARFKLRELMEFLFNQRIVFNPDPTKDRCSMKIGLPNFEGTLIGLDINIGDQRAFKDLIDRIGDAYQLGVKKTKEDYTKRIRFT